MTESRSLQRIRSLLLFSAAVTCLGVAFSVSNNQEFGSYVTVLGAVTFIYAVHKFGRTGPDEP